MRKLKLDVETLEVASFATGDAAAETRGTVEAASDTRGVVISIIVATFVFDCF